MVRQTQAARRHDTMRHAKAGKEGDDEKAAAQRHQSVGAATCRADYRTDGADRCGSIESHGRARSAWRKDWRKTSTRDDDTRASQRRGTQGCSCKVAESEGRQDGL